MIPPQYQYKIAAGHDLPSGSLTNIEAIKPTNDRYFYAPEGYYAINPGTIRLRLDGTNYETGYPSTRWRFMTMTRAQYQYLISTYSTGGNSYSGNVTINTRDATAGTYVKRNAIMHIPTPEQLTPNFTVVQNIEIKFSRLT